jgi:hypothetical protein
MVDDSTTRPELRATQANTLAKSDSMRRLLAVALLFAVGVFLITEFMHYLLVPDLGRNTERLLAEGLSAVIVGCLAAMLFRVVRERHKADLARLQVIAEMNHHVRNALTPISLALGDGQDRDSVRLILGAVERIEWALREILPRQSPLPEPERARLFYFQGGLTARGARPSSHDSVGAEGQGETSSVSPRIQLIQRQHSQPAAEEPAGTPAASAREIARP